MDLAVQAVGGDMGGKGFHHKVRAPFNKIYKFVLLYPIRQVFSIVRLHFAGHSAKIPLIFEKGVNVWKRFKHFFGGKM